MTRDDIDALKPGPQMDKAVAEALGLQPIGRIGCPRCIPLGRPWSVDTGYYGRTDDRLTRYFCEGCRHAYDEPEALPVYMPYSISTSEVPGLLEAAGRCDRWVVWHDGSAFYAAVGSSASASAPSLIEAVCRAILYHHLDCQRHSHAT